MIIHCTGAAKRLRKDSFRLNINVEKTKVVTFEGSPASVHLHGAHLEQVCEFKYLESLIQEKKVASTAEVHSRIGLAMAVIHLGQMVYLEEEYR